MNTLCFVRQVLGYDITAVATLLDSGLHVLITEGKTTHVGAVTLGTHDHFQTILLESHHDHRVTTLFAQGLLEKGFGPVYVACGIHSDNATKQGIKIVMSACKELLGEIGNGFRSDFAD